MPIRIETQRNSSAASGQLLTAKEISVRASMLMKTVELNGGPRVQAFVEAVDEGPTPVMLGEGLGKAVPRLFGKSEPTQLAAEILDGADFVDTMIENATQPRDAKAWKNLSDLFNSQFEELHVVRYGAATDNGDLSRKGPYLYVVAGLTSDDKNLVGVGFMSQERF